MSTLDFLIGTMKLVISLDRKLVMGTFYQEPVPGVTKTIHTCGNAACVLGYGALIATNNCHKIESASILWFNLENEIGVEAASSIVGTHAILRMRDAKSVFDGDWLYDFKHLTSDETTPQDALDYMLEVKKRLQNS